MKETLVAPPVAGSGVAARLCSRSPTPPSMNYARIDEVEVKKSLSLPPAGLASSAAAWVGDGREADILFIRGTPREPGAYDQPFVTRAAGDEAAMDRATASEKMRVAGLVLARGGSEAVKKKNARVLCGLPLLTWVLRPMKHCKTLDEIWVSTDDQEIEDIAATESCAVISVNDVDWICSRSPATQSPMRAHLVFFFAGIDVVALVQCTSPCLVPSYLDEAVNLVTSDRYDSVFSVTRDYKWRWTELSQDGTTRPLNFDPAQRLCRQEWAGEIVETGHFYVTRAEYVQDGLLQGGRCGFVELPQYLCHEVDTEDDLLIVEQKLQKYGFKGDIVLDAPSEFQ
ncbi:hypothetical protein HPB51_008469 [Rhipicephalus microplus]|uniref:N-acylneuraminate cytidylyltransferase n=1 Tax=Rhipicephalus microplus TaxID=6941 RepID=A0A9J6ES99_RHIMP|nr:hypothetical protein HPB51_008469 [Rhipicephalus microplus]